jgi:MoaA/NifB/PqqE/SkfB family radical SAM enzyme
VRATFTGGGRDGTIQSMAQVYAARYLARALGSWPRDMVDSCLARFIPIRPTVLVFNCTFVCDAECEMCGNWKRGRLQPDMTTEEIERAFESSFWRRLENVHISGGEPTTRNDLVEVCRIILGKLPNLRKLGLSTTGLTPDRAVPLLTDIVKLCHTRNVGCSIRVAIDGIGPMHDAVRGVPHGFERASRTIRAMQALRQEYRFNIGISTTIFSRNLSSAEAILSWARSQKLDIVFNMVRFTDPMLGNGDLSDACRPTGEEERRMRKFFLDRVRFDPLLDGQNYIYMHYADMIANGYHRSAPCPFQTQGLMLNPDGALFFCENSDQVGNVREEDPGAIYFRASSQAHRDRIRKERCSTCLSPCQMNVAAIKQVVPYAKFLVRASREKRKSRWTSDTA